MVYTVQLDFFIDGDERLSDECVKNELEELLDGSAYCASNVKVLRVRENEDEEDDESVMVMGKWI